MSSQLPCYSFNARTHILGGVGSVTKPTFTFILETGIPAISFKFNLAERNDLDKNCSRILIIDLRYEFRV